MLMDDAEEMAWDLLVPAVTVRRDGDQDVLRAFFAEIRLNDPAGTLPVGSIRGWVAQRYVKGSDLGRAGDAVSDLACHLGDAADELMLTWAPRRTPAVVLLIDWIELAEAYRGRRLLPEILRELHETLVGRGETLVLGVPGPELLLGRPGPAALMAALVEMGAQPGPADVWWGVLQGRTQRR